MHSVWFSCSFIKLCLCISVPVSLRWLVPLVVNGYILSCAIFIDKLSQFLYARLKTGRIMVW